MFGALVVGPLEPEDSGVASDGSALPLSFPLPPRVPVLPLIEVA
jgi:hypothetical protein